MVEICKTRLRSQVTNFDELPIPDRSLVDIEKYNQTIGLAMVKHCISLQATRGCPYNCAFCSKVWPKKHVFRSAEHIFNEVKLYYDMGIRRFSFIDDVFNLNVKNSSKFFELIIKNGMDVQFFFPAGIRGDILTPEYIDLMVEGGTINMALALETSSPRLQKLIRKNLNIEKLRENIEYMCEKHPQVVLDLFAIYGFPSETEEEALLTLGFIKGLKWLHFPYIYILKIYPNTDMECVAMEHGISQKSILKSVNLGWNELPDTLPFDKEFALRYKAKFLDEYFLARERLLHVLPYQIKVLTEEELVQKYNSYLPVQINTFHDFLQFVGIKEEEVRKSDYLDNDSYFTPGLNVKLRESFPRKEPIENALRVLFMDLSQSFRDQSRLLDDLFEAPLGLMYLLSYINQQYGSKVHGKIAKSRVDFDDYEGLKAVLKEFNPGVIGIRTLSFYKDFMHKTVEMIRQWGIEVPIIVGGPYATSDYESNLQDPNIDLVVLGEGEITFSELIGKIIENGGELPDESVVEEIAGIAFIRGRVASRKAFAEELAETEREEILSQFNDDLEDE